MKKRIFSLVLAVILVVSMLSTECFAITTESQSEIRYFNDDGYIVTTIEEVETRATNSKTGTKTNSKYNSDGSLEWQIILRGVFTYTGTTSTCKESTIAVNIYASNCSEVSRSATKSGNTASGSATISRKVLGVTVATNTYPISLSCDKNGNLS